jgi:hypothetical protein
MSIRRSTGLTQVFEEIEAARVNKGHRVSLEES